MNNNKPNDVLLPCPFCASTDVKIVTDDGVHFAQCRKCEATGPTGFKRGDEDDADWNSRAQPADQQGEPVYQVSDGVNGWKDVELLKYTACCLDPEEFEVRMLYRHAQPATANVVMPERKREATEDSDIMLDCQSEGWNACLDEVTKLNGGQS